MGILLADNFSYQGRKPLDSRLVCDTMVNMKAIVESTIYDGIIVYNQETQKFYTFKNSNTEDADLGKWRELQTSGSSDNLVASYTPADVYKEHQLVELDGKLYLVINNFTATNTELTPAENLAIDINNNNIIAVDTNDQIDTHSYEYQQQTDYIKGNLVVFEGQLYLVLKDFTSNNTEADIKDSLAADIVAGNITNVNIDTGDNAKTAEYEIGKSYNKNQLITADNIIYLATHDFIANTLEDDITNGSLIQINYDMSEYMPIAPVKYNFEIIEAGNGYAENDVILSDIQDVYVQITSVDDAGAILSVQSTEETTVSSALGTGASIAASIIPQVGSGSQWMDIPQSTTGDAVLLEDIKSNITVGGAEAGTEFAKDTSFTEFAKKILQTEVIPNITFNATNSKLYKVGDTVNGTIMRMEITNIALVSTPITKIEFKVNGIVQNTPLISEGQNIYSYEYTESITENTTVSVTLTYNGTKTIDKSANFIFVYPSYVGVIDKLELEETDITGMIEIIKAEKKYTWENINLTDSRFCYTYPASMGNLTSIKDANNFEYLGSYTKSTATIDGQNYNVYILTDPVTILNAKQIYA